MFQKNKKGQLKLSFGMIFSIILIIFFLVFAFFGIREFLGVQETITTEQFKNNFQQDIDQMWRSSRGSTEKTYSLPKDITEVCFEDDDFENMRFVPFEFGGELIEHIDMGKTLSLEVNPDVSQGRLCFENIDGRIKINLSKDFGENLVTIIKK